MASIQDFQTHVQETLVPTLGSHAHVQMHAYTVKNMVFCYTAISVSQVVSYYAPHSMRVVL